MSPVEPVTPQPLIGRGIVITRPGHQAGGLQESLERLGARAILVPGIVILPPSEPALLVDAVSRLARYDFAVFVSVNAVESVWARLVGWPPATMPIAPGPGTAEALRAKGLRAVLAPPESYDSEGLLALPQLKEVAGKRFVIFRGEGGRELLRDTLVTRGAHVDYVTCYRRGKPTQGTDVLLSAWRAHSIDALIVTSSEGLDNLWEMLDPYDRRHLRATPVFAPHSRIVARARELGVNIVVQTRPADAGLVEGLVGWFSQHK